MTSEITVSTGPPPLPPPPPDVPLVIANGVSARVVLLPARSVPIIAHDAYVPSAREVSVIVIEPCAPLDVALVHPPVYVNAPSPAIVSV